MPSRDAVKSLQERDEEILAVLTLRVRVLSLTQIARTWWYNTAAPRANAGRRIGALQAAGFVECFTMLSHPELPLSEPLATWQPGQPPPDFATLARSLQSRWTKPDEATLAVIATERAARRFGGMGGRRPRPSEATHDLHLAAVYLRMRMELPTRSRSWIPEAMLPTGRRIKVPDAIVQDGRHQTAIEFGGQYARAKLVEFHRDNSKRKRGYEIW